jgi:hypothetical protein
VKERKSILGPNSAEEHQLTPINTKGGKELKRLERLDGLDVYLPRKNGQRFAVVNVNSLLFGWKAVVDGRLWGGRERGAVRMVDLSL